MREQHGVPLADMTTLRLGGPADRVVDAETDHDVAEIAADASASRSPLFVLGGGSNVVVDDGGWPGTVLRPALRGVDVEGTSHSVRLRVGAGVVWDELVAESVERGWGGLASLSGIPGWAGAAPLQNIGAYGHEVGDVLMSVRAFDRKAHTFTRFDRTQCRLGYRTSAFRHDDRHVIIEVALELRSEDGELVRYPELARSLGVDVGQRVPGARVREAVLALRRSKGMVVDEADPESRSAGSFFVNPVIDEAKMRELERRALSLGVVPKAGAVPRFEAGPGRWKVPAAWLIEQAGFTKGTTVHGVGISHKHALALVNRGGTSSALLALESRIRSGVQDAFGVDLSREPILVRAPPELPA